MAAKTHEDYEQEVKKIVAQFSMEMIVRMRRNLSNILPAYLDPKPILHIDLDNIFENSMQPQEWLEMARFGQFGTNAEPGYIAEICQGLAETLFAVPGAYSYSIPAEWYETDMGALWAAALLRSHGDELISLTEAAALSEKTIQTISSDIARGRLTPYIDPTAGEPGAAGRRRVSKGEVEDVYNL